LPYRTPIWCAPRHRLGKKRRARSFLPGIERIETI
jgi:hypothetical protein